MNPEQAREVLARCRPGQDDPQDAELQAALAVAAHDPVLRDWLARHRHFQQRVQESLRNIAPPPNLKQRILQEQKTVRGVQWTSSPTLAAVAAVVILFLSLGVFWLRNPAPDRFVTFRDRMVGTALREYRMDVETNDLAQVRDYMRSKGAPADFEVPAGLQQIELAGGGFLRWHNNPVSMICFRRPDRKMLYLFVVKSEAVGNAPPPTPQPRQVKELDTVSWTQGGKSYLLAGPQEAGFFRKYVYPSG